MDAEACQESVTGWKRVAEHDEAAAVVGTVLELDPETRYTKTELSDAAGVPLKTLYLDGTLDELVDIGLLEKHDRDGEETVFSAAADSGVYQAATAFDDAVSEHLRATN